MLKGVRDGAYTSVYIETTLWAPKLLLELCGDSRSHAGPAQVPPFIEDSDDVGCP